MLAGECCLRLFKPRADIAEWYLPNPKYHHTLKPDFHQRYSYQNSDAVMDVQTNPQGFRDFQRQKLQREHLAFCFLAILSFSDTA